MKKSWVFYDETKKSNKKCCYFITYALLTNPHRKGLCNSKSFVRYLIHLLSKYISK